VGQEWMLVGRIGPGFAISNVCLVGDATGV